MVAIYAPFVTDGHVSFETEVPTADEFAQRVTATGSRYPWLLCEDAAGVGGYAYGTAFRGRVAYQWVVETSIYMAPRMRGTGAARSLYGALLETLRSLGFARALGGVALPNPRSVAFHEGMGFRPMGVLDRVGFKNGRWYDVGFWSLDLRSEPPTAAPEFLDTLRADDPRLCFDGGGDPAPPP